jgi:hypothetical protein
MEMTESLRIFIREHAEDDVLQLALTASRYKGVDVRFAAGQIAARQRIKEKLPEWYANDGLVYPSPLAVEQCSSGRTAQYKQRLVGREDRVCDLTGGLGADAYYLSLRAKSLMYVDRNGLYCEAAEQNMRLLGGRNVRVLHEDATELIAQRRERLSGINVFYLDPSRRGPGNERRYALQDCEPDVTRLWPLLREERCRMIAKFSPMLDIKRLLSQLTDVREVHVVAVRNECKELLIVASASISSSASCEASGAETSEASGVGASGAETPIYCVNLMASGREETFRFTYGEERAATAVLADEVGRYLYEPNASLLKAGAYKTVSSRYGLRKLHANSHLYTSDVCLPSFAGRIFETLRTYPFVPRQCRHLSARIPRANLAVRNFPLSVDALRRQTGIADGGEVYLFATTLSGQRKMLVECRKKALLPDDREAIVV